MEPISLKTLQAKINKAAKYNALAWNANQELYEYCEAVYGFTPGDVDADQIIDAVLGGNGVSQGMPAKDFNLEMITLGNERGKFSVKDK